jgi:Cobalamin synthesis protein cobW C-terminal domain
MKFKLKRAHGADVSCDKAMRLDILAIRVLNGVQHILHPPEHLAAWPGEDQRSHLVFILHALEPEAIRTSLQAFQHLLGAHPTVDSD